LSINPQTPHNYARALFAKGKQRPEVIAELVRIGMRPGNAEAIVWNAENVADRKRRPTPPTEKFVRVQITVTQEQADVLAMIAKMRKTRRGLLASRIVRTVIEDQLVSKILDDEGAK
jgi:hypothetical protein